VESSVFDLRSVLSALVATGIAVFLLPPLGATPGPLPRRGFLCRCFGLPARGALSLAPRFNGTWRSGRYTLFPGVIVPVDSQHRAGRVCGPVAFLAIPVHLPARPRPVIGPFPLSSTPTLPLLRIPECLFHGLGWVSGAPLNGFFIFCFPRLTFLRTMTLLTLTLSCTLVHEHLPYA